MSVSGRYRGAIRLDRVADEGAAQFAIDLRVDVDVDGAHASNAISADIFALSGGISTYAGSLRVAQPTRRNDADGATILSGEGMFTWPTASPWVEVEIPRAARGDTATAILRRGAPDRGDGPSYDCVLETSLLRRVELTEDVEEGVLAVAEYDTVLLASGGADRRLSLVSAFAEAGIEIEVIGPRRTIAAAAAGPDASWCDAELHSAMENRLGARTSPDWAVWLLHAGRHDLGVRGWMFDQYDARQRQGCAIFHDGTPGNPAERDRELMFAAVHELGHAFGLRHCFADAPGRAARPDSLSWMNYPHEYPRGADDVARREAFWSSFGFAFDREELAHLRHGYRDDVIMGGTPFERPGRLVSETWPRAVDQYATGLRLRVMAPSELRYGVPAAVGLELRATSDSARFVAPVLGPRPGSVDIFIRRPDRTEYRFRPLLQHCRGDSTQDVSARPLVDYALVHYGRDGFAFAEPGAYELRARYQAPDGAVVLSEAVSMEVRAPSSRADRDAQELLYGDEQGHLLSLVGSTAPSLATGDGQLQEFIDRHPYHPAAVTARVVRGTNAARAFKTLEADGSVRTGRPDAASALALLGPALDVDRLRRVASRAPEAAAAALVAGELRSMLPARGRAAGAAAFIASRCDEIAAAIPSLS